MFYKLWNTVKSILVLILKGYVLNFSVRKTSFKVLHQTLIINFWAKKLFFPRKWNWNLASHYKHGKAFYIEFKWKFHFEIVYHNFEAWSFEFSLQWPGIPSFYDNLLVRLKQSNQFYVSKPLNTFEKAWFQKLL